MNSVPHQSYRTFSLCSSVALYYRGYLPLFRSCVSVFCGTPAKSQLAKTALSGASSPSSFSHRCAVMLNQQLWYRPLSLAIIHKPVFGYCARPFFLFSCSSCLRRQTAQSSGDGGGRASRSALPAAAAAGWKRCSICVLATPARGGRPLRHDAALLRSPRPHPPCLSVRNCEYQGARDTPLCHDFIRSFYNTTVALHTISAGTIFIMIYYSHLYIVPST